MKMAVLPVAALLGIVAWSSLYVVGPGEQVILTTFGKLAESDAVTKPGLKLKTPFIQTVNRLEKRILEWDGPPVEMVTRDKQNLEVDYFCRWRIIEPSKFFVRLRDERSADSRLTAILASATKGEVARHELIELIRTTKDRKIAEEARVVPVTGGGGQDSGAAVADFRPITVGRAEMERRILKEARPNLVEFGIELIDVRIKRLNYDESVERKIWERMISERRQIAERFRSEGAAIAARISGERERDLQRIESEAYKKVQSIRGEADAKATEIYTKVFNQSEDAAEFYAFQKTLETYETSLPQDTALLFSADAEIFRFLRSASIAEPKGKPAPPAPLVSPAPTAPPAAATPVEATSPQP